MSLHISSSPRVLIEWVLVLSALVVSTIHGGAATQAGILKHEVFNGATRAQVESGAVAIPSSIEYVNAFQFTDVGDNYTRRVSGFFVPAVTGKYVFFINSDDDSDLFLSTDATPQNKRLVAQETAWSNALEWTSSTGGSSLDQKRSNRFKPPGSTTAPPFEAGIPLTAGEHYYLEGVHHEGTDGDNFAVTFKLVSEDDPAPYTDSALTGALIALAVPEIPTIVSQPVSRRTSTNQTVSFSVVVDPPTATLQWYKNAIVISGATSTTYITPPLLSSDNAAIFHARATLGAATTKSSNAVVTIGNLVPIPGYIRREFWGAGVTTRADVEAGNAPEPDSTTSIRGIETPTNQADNYVERVSGLFLPPITGNYVFFIASNDDSDLFLSTDKTPANKRLIALETVSSGVRNWLNADGVPATLTAAQATAQKRSDKFIPDPANDPTATPEFAAGIPLAAGTPYYFEGVHNEVTGSDSFGVTYKLVGEPEPAAGTAPRITPDMLGGWALQLNGAFINVTNAPQNATAVQFRTATFSIGADSGYLGDDSGVRPPIYYQWQTAPSGSSTFTNIPGANGTTYTTPLLPLDRSGRQYRVSLIGGDATTNSAIGILTVTADLTPPRPVTVTAVNAAGTVVNLTFDERLEVASTQTGTNYSFAPGTVAGASAVLNTNTFTVSVTTAAPLTPNVENTLTITGVRDISGNAVAGNTTIKFTFDPVTYEENILFDKPVAYYRFEEISGSVATNIGSVVGDGVYSIGDEAAPGEGGTAGEAKGDAGPRPPQFAGFSANNRGATFDGVSDWVDTRQQYLQGLASFTLEYWMKPRRTNTLDQTVWPDRVALVGQNDAIEYGFITPGVIQIWTPGGGSLDTAYTFPDDQWHHVATIADGTNLKTYFDGNLAATGGTTTANYGTSTYFVHIGGGGGFDLNGNWFTGEMDEVAIFTNAVPASRVVAHYRAGRDGGVITISGAVTPAPPSDTILSAAAAGQSVTISWSPTGGTLQSKLTLESPTWSNVGTTNPATIQALDNARFFRVKR